MDHPKSEIGPWADIGTQGGDSKEFDLAALAQVDLSPIGTIETALAVGANLPGYPGAVCYRKFKRRLQRRAEARFSELCRALGPADIALDLGANIGDLTVHLAANGATVYAYEPEPETFGLLSERFAQSANVHLHQAAVSDRDGTTELILPASFREKPRSASKAASIAHDRYLGPGHIAHTVFMHNITTIIRALPKLPALIKMDIEGAEVEAVGALIPLLTDASKPMRMAIASYHMRNGRKTHEIITPMLLAAGFTVETGFPEHPTTWAEIGYGNV